MVKSPIKIIDSGTAPTTANLGEGQIAFGTVDGATKLYGSDGTTVSELGGGGGGEVNVIAPLTVDTVPTTNGAIRTIAIGNGASCTGASDMTAIGHNATIRNIQTVAVGAFSQSTRTGATSVGYAAEAKGAQSIAVGNDSSVETNVSAGISIGNVSYVSGEGGVAVGQSAQTEGAASVALGNAAKALDDNVVSVGSGDESLGPATRRIVNVTDPTGNQDAATKKYVDDQYSTLEAQIDDKGADITALQGQVSTLETTVAGKADTSALANYATKTELNAKADQTTVDSLTTTVNGKVSSITAGEGISITGTATDPVISATGGTVISGFRLDYANAQTVSIEALTSWTSPSDGYFVVATWVGVPGPGGRTSFTVNGASVVDPDYGASASTLPDLPTYLPLSKGDVIATEFESGVRGTFYPLKNSTVTPNEFTDTGWMEITNSSGDGLPYLTGPFVIPSGSSLKIRKYGKRVNLVGTVQITEDLTYTNTEDFISIKQNQTVSSRAQFDGPPGTTTEVNEDYSRFMPLGNRYSELQFTDHGQIAECCYGFAAYNKISPTNGNSLRVKIAPAFSTSISNGTIININLSWDTED